MKKIIALICTFALCMSLTACSKSPKEIPDDFSGIELVKWGEADRLVFWNLEELEKASDVVVVGTLVEDTTQKVTYRYNDFFEKEIIYDVHSYNTVEISRVLKGDFEVGDTLVVQQPYAVVDGKLITDSDLTPMVNGDTWVFFLSKIKDGLYCYQSDSDGRYPVSGKQNRRLAISEYSELGVYERENFKDGIYSEIVEKYGI